MFLTSPHLSRSLADRWGTTGDFTTNFLPSLRFSAFRSMMFNSMPVHSLMLSSHRFLCLLLYLQTNNSSCDRDSSSLSCIGNRLFTVQYNSMQYNTIQYNTIQYNTIQYNTIQYNTIQCNAMQCNAMQCNARRDETRRDETRRDETRRGEARRGEARRGKARQGKARQCNAM